MRLESSLSVTASCSSSISLFSVQLAGLLFVSQFPSLLTLTKSRAQELEIDEGAIQPVTMEQAEVVREPGPAKEQSRCRSSILVSFIQMQHAFVVIHRSLPLSA